MFSNFCGEAILILNVKPRASGMLKYFGHNSVFFHSYFRTTRRVVVVREVADRDREVVNREVVDREVEE